MPSAGGHFAERQSWVFEGSATGSFKGSRMAQGFRGLGTTGATATTTTTTTIISEVDLLASCETTTPLQTGLGGFMISTIYTLNLKPSV